jgi:hypothetical protein
MKKFLIYGLVTFFFVSCEKAKCFEKDFIKKIDSANKIEIKVIKSGQKKSIVFVDKEKLDFLKDIIKPQQLIEKKLTDDLNFPVDILLYQDDKVIGQLGIQFGHIQYIYYKGDRDFEFKTEMNYRLGMYIQEL